MMFKYNRITESELETVPWVFKSEVELDISLQECWNILTDDAIAAKTWFPETTDYTYSKKPGLGATRTVVFRHWLFNILLGGPATIAEEFDVWEDKGTDMKRFQFWFTAASRPQFLTYKRAREEFKVEAISDTKCKFIRTVGMEPAFATRFLLGWMVYPTLRSIFTVKCPNRLAQAVENKILPQKKTTPAKK